MTTEDKVPAWLVKPEDKRNEEPLPEWFTAHLPELSQLAKLGRTLHVCDLNTRHSEDDDLGTVGLGWIGEITQQQLLLRIDNTLKEQTGALNRLADAMERMAAANERLLEKN